MLALHPVVLVVAAYVLGSIPAALLAGRLHGVDLRKQGSGNLGATNVVRVLGMKTGVAVFLFDAAKGAVPVLFFPGWSATTLDARILALIYGIAAIAGHVRPVFLRFGKGGKGVATASGVFFALAPIPSLIAFSVFVAVVLISGYVSLGSLVSALVLPVALAFTVGPRAPMFLVSIVIVAFVFWTHRANIGRLRRGEENRFGRRAAG